MAQMLLNFDSNLIILLWLVQKCQKITRKTFPSNICHKWIIYYPKTWRGWLTTLKFYKKLNCQWKRDLIYTNICQVFSSWKIICCSTPPHMLIFSHCSQQLTKEHREWIVLNSTGHKKRRRKKWNWIQIFTQMFCLK